MSGWENGLTRAKVESCNSAIRYIEKHGAGLSGDFLDTLRDLANRLLAAVPRTAEAPPETPGKDTDRAE